MRTRYNTLTKTKTTQWYRGMNELPVLGVSNNLESLTVTFAQFCFYFLHSFATAPNFVILHSSIVGIMTYTLSFCRHSSI